jgi:hypothetical protein
MSLIITQTESVTLTQVLTSRTYNSVFFLLYIRELAHVRRRRQDDGHRYNNGNLTFKVGCIANPELNFTYCFDLCISACTSVYFKTLEN